MTNNKDNDIYTLIKNNLERINYIIQPIIYRVAASSSIYVQIALGALIPILNIIIDAIRVYLTSGNNSVKIPKTVRKNKLDSVTLISYMRGDNYNNEIFGHVLEYISNCLDTNNYKSEHNSTSVSRLVNDKPFKQIKNNS